MNLRIPGPTPVPEQVLAASAKPMINHRGPEFAKLIGKITPQLQGFFQTKNDVVILTGAGTGAMEAAVVNTLSPGQKCIVVSIGVFGDRFASIAKAFGADVVKLDFPWGTAANAAEVGKTMDANPDVKVVFVTQNETSTGVVNDLAAISAEVKGRGALLVVDAISGMAAMDLPVDKWNCDVVISGSQKAWMIPPGLAMVSISAEGWKAAESAKMPRMYWDFKRAKDTLEKGQTPWTPAVSLFYALSESLDMMEQEGLERILSRHLRIAKKTRDGLKRRGLELFAQDETRASNSVTAFKIPAGIDGAEMVRKMRLQHGVVVAGGQQTLSGKIARIGHLGFVSDADIDGVFVALDAVLKEMGFSAK